jgi:hypothetical protein
MTALIVFAVGVVIGWIWQTIRNDRLLNEMSTPSCSSAPS